MVQKHAHTHTQIKQLCEVLAALPDPDAVRVFLEDLCTPSELAAMADRWVVAGLIDQGLPYRKIYEQTGVSTATVTRVARCLSFGTGGYRRALASSKEGSL